MPLLSDLILTPTQVGEQLQLPVKHVRKMFQDGTLPGFKRTKRLWGILLSELEGWLSRRGRIGPVCGQKNVLDVRQSAWQELTPMTLIFSS